MDIEADPIAIVSLEILAGLPRDNEKIEGPVLLSLMKEVTGDNTLQPYNVKDSIAILREVGAVRVFAAMDTLSREYGFNVVLITPFGRNYLKSRKINRAFKPARGNEQATIKVEGDVHGDVIQAFKGDITQTNINSYAELIEAIKADKMLSEYGKEETLRNIALIREEIEKEQPDIGLIKKSWKWITRNGPRIAEGVLIRLIPPLIMSQLG